MKNHDITKVIMNPVRLRIMQFLMLHETATTRQLKEELTDVPPASLYRHIKILEEAKIILVVKENRIRGVVEKVYQLNKENSLNEDSSDTNISKVIQTGLLSIMGEFTKYLEKEENDPQKDFLFLSTFTLLLSDDEFMKFTKEIGEIFNKVVHNKMNEERKVRRITLISSPCEK